MAEILSVLTAADSVRVARTRDPEAIGRLLAPGQPLEPLLEAATALREEGHGGRVAYSPTASFPLTAQGRHSCEHCTFVPPRQHGAPAYMPVAQVLHQARQAAAVGCREALLTLGDQPERRCPVARDELLDLGSGTTEEYLANVAGRVLAETGLLPHAHTGALGRDELALLRTVSASQGLLLGRVRTCDRLPDQGEARRWGVDERPEARLAPRSSTHGARAPSFLTAEDGRQDGRQDGRPRRRCLAGALATIQLAGELRVPFTTGLLLDAGDTLDERAQMIAVLAELVQQEHVQALVVQRRRAGPGTRTVAACEPGIEELLRAAAVVRLAAGPQANVQAGPDLGAADAGLLLRAGVNDWGAVPPAAVEEQSSPAGPWTLLGRLEAATRAAGCQLVARLCVYPEYVRDYDRALRWLHPGVLRHVLAASDGEGLARQDGWWPSGRRPAPVPFAPVSFAPAPIRADVRAVLGRAEDGQTLDEAEVELLFRARGEETQALARLADAVRCEVNGDLVTYVVNGEVSYTDVCGSGCRRRAAGDGGQPEDPRGWPRPATLGELVERAREVVTRGATEVRMHGGIGPGCTGDCHVELCSAVKAAVPEPHLHAFSPFAVHQGAATAERTLPEQLALLKRAGLGSLLGTAEEVLDDRVRRHLCPDELTTRQWVELVAEAHRQGLPTTSTIMFGRLEGPESWARHLVVLRELQARTGGITEFVPLPFVQLQGPKVRKGQARQGPTWEEIVKMHAVARLALRGWIDNIQVSRVQHGLDGCAEILRAGANDLGGVLMQERVAGAAGAGRGREVRPARLHELIRSVGRVPAERTTLYAIRQVFEPEQQG
jgi:FO synthase